MLHAALIKSLRICFITLLFCTSAFAKQHDNCSKNTDFEVGVGIYDITGPAAEQGMMGYGMMRQRTDGILQRLWARAFIIVSPCNQKRIVVVNADLGQVFQGIKQQVVAKLKNKYGALYTDENVLLTATHTHSGPGGYSTDTFYNITTLGFNRANFDAIVDGIVSAIERAQKNIAPAQIKFASGELDGISFNRSPQAYLLNPSNERAQYQADTDKEMNLVRFDNRNGTPIGLINWFSLHGVSMNNKNGLINGDNKGYAEYLFEKDFHADYGTTSFVAAFAQANAGDVSPNKYGSEGGTGLAGITAIEKAGRPQYEKAKQLFDSASELIKGPVDFRHTFIAMDDVVVHPAYTNGEAQKTCPAAIGISMLAGTQDGEGVGEQGVTCDTINSLMLPFVCSLSTTSCQGAKPIVVQTGLMKPHPWTPNILPLQIVRIGNLIIVAAPFELTTMTGRRIKAEVAKIFSGNEHIVLAALSNAYAGYVATQEEYQMQRYEAASTHFGPWTEAALRQEYSKLAKALAENVSVPAGPEPLDLLPSQMNLQPGVLFDSTPINTQFGAIYVDVNKRYKPGETVQVQFWGAHPKNNFHIQDSFLAVQQLKNGSWQTIRTDRDWDTEYHWQREGIANSIVTIVWRIPADIEPGQYRIAHFGDARSVLGNITPYAGFSSAFQVM